MNIYFSRKEELNACIEAGGELVQRKDDNENTIVNRLEVYRDQTEPLVAYYLKRDQLKKVNAVGSMDEVYQRLIDAL